MIKTIIAVVASSIISAGIGSAIVYHTMLVEHEVALAQTPPPPINEDRLAAKIAQAMTDSQNKKEAATAAAVRRSNCRFFGKDMAPGC